MSRYATFDDDDIEITDDDEPENLISDKIVYEDDRHVYHQYNDKKDRYYLNPSEYDKKKLYSYYNETKKKKDIGSTVTTPFYGEDDVGNTMTDSDFNRLEIQNRYNNNVNIYSMHPKHELTSKYRHSDLAYTLDGKPFPNPSERTHFIRVMFSHQNESSKEHWLNRCIERIQSSDIIHTELFFESDMLTCSVDKRNPVYLKANKKYDYPAYKRHWTAVRLELDWEHYDKIYNFCMNERGKLFDEASLYLMWIYPLFSDGGNGGWVCSKLVSSALKYGGVFNESINIMEMTPASVYRFASTVHINKYSVVKSKKIVHNYNKNTGAIGWYDATEYEMKKIAASINRNF
jgi:hypothetical protein